MLRLPLETSFRHWRESLVGRVIVADVATYFRSYFELFAVLLLPFV